MNRAVTRCSVWMIFWIMLAQAAWAADQTSLIERIETDLAKDRAYSPEERAAYLNEFRQRLGSYAFDVLKPEGQKAADVVMALVTEGSFNGSPVEQTVGVAVAAYTAMSRGAPPSVVQGIALYGFRKQVEADKIAAWANGYQECLRFKVPAAVAKDLVYNAAEHDWDLDTFFTFKWGLVQAAKAGYDLHDFSAYVFGHYLKAKDGPGGMLRIAMRVFRDASLSGDRPKLPPYQSPCIEDKPAAEPKPPIEQKPPELKPEPKKIPGDFSGRLDLAVKSFLGTPYVWGGHTRSGTDCSGFVQTVFGELGLALPRSSKAQWKVGAPVESSALRKGDLLFFMTTPGQISHVGIMIDPKARQFAHASSGRGVVFSDLGSKYYLERYAGARRVVGGP